MASQSGTNSSVPVFRGPALAVADVEGPKGDDNVVVAVHLDTFLTNLTLALLLMILIGGFFFMAWRMQNAIAGKELYQELLTSAGDCYWVSSSAADTQKIPHKLHQIWMDFKRKPGTDKPPAEYESYSQLLRELHPTWEYKLWSEDDVKTLIQTHFPDFLDTWLNYDMAIKKHDSARVCILLVHGGVYMDHDMVPLRSFDTAVDPYQLVLAQDPVGESSGVTNDIIGSVPNHPFFRMLLSEYKKTAHKMVYESTGPYVYNRVLCANAYYYKFAARHGIHVHAKDYFHPAGSTKFKFSGCTPSELRQQFPNSYAVGLCHGSWAGMQISNLSGFFK